MIKRLIDQEDRKITNTHTPNIKAPKYIKPLSTKMNGKIDSKTITLGDFDTPTFNN